MTADEIARALAGIGRVSRYGVVRAAGAPEDRPLLDAAGDPAAVASRLGAVATGLGTAEPRVAASSVQYELAERLWTVSIAVWSGHGLVLDLSRFLVGQDPAVWRLAAPRPHAWRALDRSPGQVAGELARPVLDHLDALHRAIRATTPIADGLLWGNAATAATLALGPIGGSTARARAAALVTALLDLAPLRNRVTFVDGAVLRRSCCLYYRTRHARTCGDCPLPAPAAARAIARLGPR